jgi:hypothetical protein
VPEQQPAAAAALCVFQSGQEGVHGYPRLDATARAPRAPAPKTSGRR